MGPAATAATSVGASDAQRGHRSVSGSRNCVGISGQGPASLLFFHRRRTWHVSLDCRHADAQLIRIRHCPPTAGPVVKKKPTGPRKKVSVKGKGKPATDKGPLNVMRDLTVDPKMVESMNALSSLPPWDAMELRQENVGKVYRVSDTTLKAIGLLPRSLQKNAISQTAAKTPAFVFRKATYSLLSEINKLGSRPRSADHKPALARFPVLVGPSGVGKSVLLLQAVDVFLAKNWIVLYFQNTYEWVDATSPFVKSGDLYDQPALAVRLLQQIKKMNQRQLSNVVMSGTHTLGTQTLADMDLASLVDLGIRDKALASGVFAVLLKELANPATERGPMLVAFDALNSLFCETEYRDTESRRLLGSELTLGRAVLDLFAGGVPKAVVLGALDATEDVVRSPFLEQSLGLRPVPIPEVTSRSVILPEGMAPTATSPLASVGIYADFLKSGKLEPYTVYPYDGPEVESAVSLYESTNVLRNPSNLPRDVLVGKFLAVTGGNPLKVFRLASHVTTPGVNPPRKPVMK
ncbi:mitochondrial ribosomal death-associated protein 3-domain-containing protein [Hyaloraphidium curvatum]|nr:mitochondrial ribosomal death-associated protein 3-domain-containing protein [Hyaloraphidium curvatum]